MPAGTRLMAIAAIRARLSAYRRPVDVHLGIRYCCALIIDDSSGDASGLRVLGGRDGWRE